MGEPAAHAGIRELRQHASRYVDLAAGGQPVDITNRALVIDLDASTIVRLVVDEAESGALRAWLRRRRTSLVTRDLSRVEVPAPACGQSPPRCSRPSERSAD